MAGLPGVTLPTNNPPISEPRELSERKFSTASRSRRSIRSWGIRTDMGFRGTSHVKKGGVEAGRSKYFARAVDSVIGCLRPYQTILLTFCRILFSYLWLIGRCSP